MRKSIFVVLLTLLVSFSFAQPKSKATYSGSKNVPSSAKALS